MMINLILFSIQQALASPTAQPLLGVWLVDGIATVNVSIEKANSGQLEGVIVQASNQDWVGKILLTNISPEENKGWTATLHSPQYEMSKMVSLEATSSDSLVLTAEFALFEKKFVWTRIEE